MKRLGLLLSVGEVKVKKKTLLIVSLIIVGTVSVSVGCAPQPTPYPTYTPYPTHTPLPKHTPTPLPEEVATTPKEILDKSHEEMETLNSFHTSTETTIEYEEEEAGGLYTIQADIEMPDKVYIILKAKNGEIGEEIPVEVLMIGRARYVKWPDRNKWEEMGYDHYGWPEILTISRESLVRLPIGDYAKDVRKEPDEEIGGVAVYQLTFSIDWDEYIKVLVGPLAEFVPEILVDGKGKGRVWIGKEDLFRRKIEIDSTFYFTGSGETREIRNKSSTMLSDFNKPAKIPMP